MTNHNTIFVLVMLLLTMQGCSMGKYHVAIHGPSYTAGPQNRKSSSSTTPDQLEQIAHERLIQEGVSIDMSNSNVAVLVTPAQSESLAKVAFFDTNTNEGWIVTIDPKVRAVDHKSLRHPPWPESVRVPINSVTVLVAAPGDKWYTPHDFDIAARAYLKQKGISFDGLRIRTDIRISVGDQAGSHLATVSYIKPDHSLWFVVIGADGRGMKHMAGIEQG